MQGTFTLNDFRKQMAMVANPGLIQKMMGIMPGIGPLHDAVHEFNAAEMKSLFGIIDAMTPAERSNSQLIDATRRRRIADGAGCELLQVGELLKQYETMAEVMSALASKGLRQRMKMVGDVELKEREWPFKPRRDEDDDNPPPDGTVPPLPA